MTVLSIAYAALFYAATAILVVGVALKIRSYAGTPAPLLIPTTPAPTTTGGVALRMLREVALFPMNQRAEDLLMNAPSDPTNEQLRELRLRVLPKEA